MSPGGFDALSWFRKVQVAYSFRCPSPVTFECELRMPVSHKQMSYVFGLAKNEIEDRMRREGADVEITKSPDEMTRFDMPKEYYNYVCTVLTKEFAKVGKEVFEDGRVRIVTSKVVKAFFVRPSGQGSWTCTIEYEGDCVIESKPTMDETND